MSIQHTAISYYGLNYVEHAEQDFREMLDHGCDTVILAITEFDMDFWFPNINAIVKKAHQLGLRVLADTWGTSVGNRLAFFSRIISTTARFPPIPERFSTLPVLTPTPSGITF